MVENEKKNVVVPKKSGVPAYRTVNIFEDGHQYDDDGLKVMVVTKFMDFELFKKKVMEKLKLSQVDKVFIVSEKGEPDIDIAEDLSIIPAYGTLRITGESYIKRLRELEEYDQEGIRAAEERRLDLKRRVARNKAMKLGLPDPFAVRKDPDEEKYDYDSDGPAEAEFKGLTVPITFQPGPGNKLNAFVGGWTAPGYSKAYPQVRAGDFVTAVNDLTVFGKPFSEIMQLIRESPLPRKIYFNNYIEIDVVIPKPEEKKKAGDDVSLSELDKLLLDPEKAKHVKMDETEAWIHSLEKEVRDQKILEEKKKAEEPTKEKGLEAADNLGFRFKSVERNRGCKLEILVSKIVAEKYPTIRATDRLSFINNIKVIREKFEIIMMEFYSASMKLPMTLTFRQSMRVEEEDDTTREDRMHRANYNFLMSVRDGNFDEVNQQIDGGQDVHCRDETNCTALHYASSLNYLKIVKLLVERGADINAADVDQKTPLLYASARGNTEIASYLLEMGAINGPDVNGRYGLHYAAINNNVECVKLFINTKSTQIDAQESNWGWTALHFAASQGNLTLIKLFVRAGAEMHIKSKIGKEILQLSQENKQTSVIKYLEGQINLEPLHLIFQPNETTNIYAGSFEGCTKELAVKFDINTIVVVNDTGKPRAKIVSWVDFAKWLTIFHTDCTDGVGEDDWMSFANHIPGVVRFIHDEIANKPLRNILIVSRRGKCRSCLYAVSYMLLKMNLPLKEGLQIAQFKRPPMKIPEKFATGMQDLDDALQKRFLEIRRMQQKRKIAVEKIVDPKAAAIRKKRKTDSKIASKKRKINDFKSERRVEKKMKKE